jgi:hypothetical protein
MIISHRGRRAFLRSSFAFVFFLPFALLRNPASQGQQTWKIKTPS